MTDKERAFRKAIHCLSIAVEQSVAEDIAKTCMAYVDELKAELAECQASLADSVAAKAGSGSPGLIRMSAEDSIKAALTTGCTLSETVW